ncbi:MAG: hypothetical protein KatS3mg031_2756 [Chitinophagales bacterium]|nr:MAG: hypothetical protein KatS3mg031_2756 [Chitinophagales bacterium]
MKRIIILLNCLILLATHFAFAVPPANDECANAVTITCGQTISGSTTEATQESLSSCGTAITAPGVWYTFTGTGGSVTLSLCNNATYDTKISVFTDGCGTLTCIGGNDDASGCSGFTSEFTFTSLPGIPYLVLVHGFGSSTGDFDLTLNCQPVVPAPANDDCLDAISIQCGQTISGSTNEATQESLSSCGTSITAPGVWYTFTGTGSSVTLSLCNNATYDTKISVFTDGCGTLTCIGGNDDASGCGLTSEFSFNTQPGIPYLVLVHGFGSGTGDFDLTLNCQPVLPAPANDDCLDATVTAVNTGTPAVISGTNAGATMDAFEASEFGFAVVWESFTLTGNCNNVTISYCGSVSQTFNVFATLYRSCTPGDFVTDDDGQADETTCGDGNFTYTFSNLPAGTYLIPIFADPAFLDTLGPYTVTITANDCPPAPANDLCADALAIGCGDTVAGYTQGATIDGVAPCGGDNTAPGVWYTILGTGDNITLSTCDAASFDTKISVFTDGCGTLTCIGGNDDATGCSGFTSEFTFTSLPGIPYLVLVHGFASQIGSFTLSVSCAPPAPAPSNDNCSEADADTIPNGSSLVLNGTTLGATADAFESSEFVFNGTSLAVVWEAFTLTAPCSNVDIAYCGSFSPTFNTFARLYRSCTPGDFVTDDDGQADETTCGDGNLIYTFSNLPAGTYLIPVFADGAFLDPLGPYTVTITANDCPPAPANDLCADALAIFCGESVSGTTQSATADSVSFCGTSNSAPGVWYSFTGTGDFVTVSTCNAANYDTKISVFTDGCGTLTCVGGNDDFTGCSGFTSEVGFLSTPGVQYLILVHGFQNESGSFTLSVNCEPVTATNDLCTSAIPIGCGDTITGSTADATPDAAPFCSTSNTAPGVWYRYTGDGSFVTASLCNAGTNYDTKLSVYTGDCTSLLCEVGNDDDSGCSFSSLSSSVEWLSTAGTDYFILVHGFGSNTGSFELTLNCNPVELPANDDPCNAEPLTLGTPAPFDNTFATALPGEISPGVGSIPGSTCNSPDGWCSLDPDVQNSLWYTFVAPPSGHVIISSEPLDGQLAVYSVTDCGDFSTYTEIGANDDGNPACLFCPLVELHCLMPGATYYVQLDGFDGEIGTGTITVVDAGPGDIITGYTIVNAVTDTDIRPLQDGDIINKRTMPPFNIRADVCRNVGSVGFDLNGAPFRTENFAPYAVAGDVPTGNYQTWYAVPGDYQMLTTPFNGPHRSGGLAGQPDVIHFTIVDDDCVILTVSVTTDAFGNETSWELEDLTTGTILGSVAEGTYGNNMTFTRNFCVDPNHCFEFRILDAFGDGICCAFGNGSYSITLDGSLVAFGGNFADSETTNFGNCPLDCQGTVYGPAIQDVNGTCCVPGDMDCAGICFGNSTQTPPYLRVVNSQKSWRKLKLGYDPNTLWINQNVIAGGNNQVCITLRDAMGNAQWNRIQIRPQTASSSGPALSNYVPVNAGTNWFTVCIPLSDFPGFDFTKLRFLELPYSNGADPFEIHIQRIEFSGGASPFLWFGDTKTDNYHDGQSGSGSALFAELIPAAPCSSPKTTLPSAYAPANAGLNVYPNPFNDVVYFEFSTDEDARVALELFTITGSKVATLFEGDVQKEELRKIEFSGKELSDGIYVYKLRSDQNLITGKVTLAR